MRAALLLLADGRYPGGGHAHSGGVEAAAGRIRNVDDLDAFLTGRLHTAGRCAASLAAAACTGGHDWAALDTEADARTPSPAQRTASRRQGRGLLRAATLAWPGAVVDSLHAQGSDPHHAVALGAAAAAAALHPVDAAVVAAYASISGPAAAAVRLLGLDPLEVAALLARLASDVDLVSEESAAHAHGPLRDLPADSAPLLEIDAEKHAAWEVRLFAS
jgi:urease accessory protein